MTIFFPDISSYEAGLIIQPGTVAVIAKATEGTYYKDAQYANFKAQAAHVGAVFSAYHFLKAGGGMAQADYCHAMVGSTPVMLDVETEGTSKPTVADCAAFIARMRALGGRVWGAYFPQWFWQQVGGNLASLGVAVVASNYTAYSDSGPGWAPYGGVTPSLWQYTDKQSYGGQSMDFNAYKGTVAELAALINGTAAPTPSTGGPDVNLTDTVAVSAGFAARYQDTAPDGFTAGANISVATLLEGSAIRAANNEHLLNAIAAKIGAQTVDVNALAAKLGPLLHPTTDVAALVAALAPHVGAPDPAAFAAALAPHIKVTSA